MTSQTISDKINVNDKKGSTNNVHKFPTYIHKSNLSKLPRRSNFLDKKLKSIFYDRLNKQKSILFLPNDIFETHSKISTFSKKEEYVIYLFGIMPDGTKTCVILEDIDIYFDIVVPTNTSYEVFKNKIVEQFETQNFNYKKMTKHEGLPIRGFRLEPLEIVRIHFNKLWGRQKALKFYIKSEYETSSDDLGWKFNYYFPKAAREFKFNTADWNVISNYKVVDKKLTTNCDVVIKVPISNLKAFTGDKLAKDYLSKDKTMVMTWDIETYTYGAATSDVPKPEDKNYEIFCICMTFHWQSREESLFKVGLVSKRSCRTPTTDTVILCDNELGILMVFAKIFKRMSPDIVIAFNGGRFDWPICIQKYRNYGKLKFLKENLSSLPLVTEHWNQRSTDTEENIYNYTFITERVKISAEETASIQTFNVPGWIDTDAMVTFKQLYPAMDVRSSFSLNFFLQENKISSKDDLEYKEMFRIYAKALELSKFLKDNPNEIKNNLSNVMFNVLNMGRVLQYCTIDAFRCQQLYLKQNIISSKRDLSTLSYVTLYDSFFRANGQKVRNLIGMNCFQLGYIFSNQAYQEINPNKYPGAWVFKPNKGLNNKMPIVSIDAASLYPSIIMGKNISIDKMVKDPKRVVELEKLGYTLYASKFLCNDGAGPEVKAWFVQHRGIMNSNQTGDLLRSNGEKSLPGESIGLFGFILKDLFGKRKIVKNKYLKLFSEVEQMTIDGYANTPEFKEKCFIRDKFDSRQKAMKVHMNTFYGETGNKRSPIFEICVAGGVTTLGQDIIKSVAARVKKIGCNVEYGDSVTADTPILIKNSDNNILYAEIQNISKNKWESYNDKECIHIDNIQVYTENGFTKINKIIRHLTNKRIFRIYSPNGVVDVTEDHSLLDINCNMVTPKEIIDSYLTKTPIKLLHWEYNSSIINSTKYGNNDIIFTTSDKLIAANKYIKFYYIYNNVWITIKSENIYEIHGSNYNCYNLRPTIIELPKERRYVYDLETENHHFAAGIGRLVVHNTDSIYLTCPPSIYADVKNQYELNAITKKEYWTKLVEITMVSMNKIRDEVNLMLINKLDTDFIKMAYEEVLFPTVLCGKKKYYGRPHVKTVNFSEFKSLKDIFIRGIDIKKTGQTKLAKELGYEIMKESLDIDNDKELIDIIHCKINKFYDTKWDLRHFILSAKYKKAGVKEDGTPKKGNQTVLPFIKRMVETLEQQTDQLMVKAYELPEFGDRFKYVVVEKDQKYNIRGCKIALKKSDKMEFIDVFVENLIKSNPMKIDRDYYMKSILTGLFARFISYHPDFKSDTLIDGSDKYEIKQAVKYITNYCKKWDIGSIDEQERSKRYKAIYRLTLKNTKLKNKNNLGTSSELINNLKLLENFKSDDSTTNIILYLKHMAQNKAIEVTDVNYGKSYIAYLKENNYNLLSIKKMFKSRSRTSITKLRNIFLDNCEVKLLESVIKDMPNILKIIEFYEKSINDIVKSMRTINYKSDITMSDNDIKKISNFDMNDIELIKKIWNIINELSIIYAMRNDLNSINIALYNEFTKVCNIVEVPKYLSPDIANIKRSYTNIEHSWT